MGARLKNAKKKAKQRAHAAKRRAQDQAIAAAAERPNTGDRQRPSAGRAA